MLNFDRSRFIDTFKAEAEEHLAKLSKGLLALEKNPTSVEILDELFRSAHTLKGSSGMMGFSQIQSIAHRLEDLFDALKKNHLTVTSVMTSKALMAVDALTDIVKAVVVGKPSPVNPDFVLRDIQDILGNAQNGLSEPTVMSAQKQLGPAEKAAAVEEQVQETIRLPIARVDALLNLVGELVIYKVKSTYKLSFLRNLMTQLKALEQHSEIDFKPFHQKMNEFSDYLTSEMMRIDPVIDELQFKIKGLRMLPCAVIFEKFERLVRDLAIQENKCVALLVKGQETELDKKVLEAIAPCLVHLLRNAVDHGIELPEQRLASGKDKIGSIELAAFQQGGKVLIRVRDDGYGIDPINVRSIALKKKLASEMELNQMDAAEILNLVFLPGFTTSPLITDVSGRGVGMDVVRREVNQLKGKVSIESQVGCGTCITIELPLTVAIMRILLVETCGQRFGLPLHAVEETLRANSASIHTIENRMALPLRSRVVPLVYLGEALGIPRGPEEGSKSENHVMVVVHSMEKRVGLIVDTILGEEEVFVKSLGKHIHYLEGVDGAAILGSGEVIAILDVSRLVVSSRLLFSTHTKSRVVEQAKIKKQVLLIEDSFTTRELEKNILETQGYEVKTAVDGKDALDKMETNVFDLIVSDIEMPRMNGFEFCKAIREQAQFAEIPLIFITALEKEEEKRRGIEVGAQAYIVKKSFDQSNLIETIERLIG